MINATQSNRRLHAIMAGISLCALLAAAGWFRLGVAGNMHVPTIDTAVVGQMAVNILEGDRPWFFAGQDYMGALEAYALALVFHWVEPSRITITLATICFAMAWIAATYFFFRRDFGPMAAWMAAIVPAFPGWPTLWYTTAPYGGYPETYFFGMVLLLLAHRFFSLEDAPQAWGHALLLAAVAGVGVWTNLQIIPYLAAAGTAGVIGFFRRPQPLSRWLPYLLVIAASLLALLPQWLAEPSHVEPPLLASLSAKNIARSWAFLWSHDLPRSLLWTYPPTWLHGIAAGLMGLLILLAVLRTVTTRRGLASHGTSLLVGAMLLFFCLMYFPHPMSGHVPRYLNGPICLIMSWAVATLVADHRAWIRGLAVGTTIALLFYHGYGAHRTSQVRALQEMETLERFESIIEQARTHHLDAIMHIGSETEGYDAARLTFLARSHPVFTSAFSERFLDHQMAWEFGDNTGYLTRSRHLPFVLGSFQSIQVADLQVISAAPYALIAHQDINRMREREVIPGHLADAITTPRDHALFDRKADTTWPDSSPPSSWVLEMEFGEVTPISGLRMTAPTAAQLPYRYTLSLRTPEGEWQQIQRSEQRIAGSYLSGTRFYFRGHHPWMDLRFDPVAAMAMRWELEAGRENPTAPALSEMFVLMGENRLWPPGEQIAHDALTQIKKFPEATVLCERGLSRLLHQQGVASHGAQAIHDRVPLPYNPRFARTQPDRFTMGAGTYLLFVEAAYRDSVLHVLDHNGIALREHESLGPYDAYAFEITAAQAGRLDWSGFVILERSQD